MVIVNSVWYGVIFLRQGYYADAVFRFTISLPDKFPDEKDLPTIIFQNYIFHPLICPLRGTLNISNVFSNWRSGEDHVWQILKYIQTIFMDTTEWIQSDYVVNNQDAKYLAAHNQVEFIARVRDCVAISKERIFDSPTTEDSHYICFEKFDSKVHGTILKRIMLGNVLTDIFSHVTRSGLSLVNEDEMTPLSMK